MLWKKGSSGHDQEHRKEKACCGNDDGGIAEAKKTSDASSCSGKIDAKEANGGSLNDDAGGAPEVSVFEFMSSGKNGDRKDMNGSTAMTGHCQTGTDGIQACLWTPGAKGQAAHKIVF